MKTDNEKALGSFPKRFGQEDISVSDYAEETCGWFCANRETIRKALEKVAYWKRTKVKEKPMVTVEVEDLQYLISTAQLVIATFPTDAQDKVRAAMERVTGAINAADEKREEKDNGLEIKLQNKTTFI